VRLAPDEEIEISVPQTPQSRICKYTSAIHSRLPGVACLALQTESLGTTCRYQRSCLDCLTSDEEYSAMSFHATNPAVSPPLPTPDRPEESQNRKRHPCVLCQQRKVKCDRSDPCANCVKARVECVSPTTLPPRRRKKRFPEAELLARLRKYEDHLRSYGADIDAINAEGPNAGLQSASTTTPTIKISTSPLDGATPEPIKSLSIRRSLKNVEK
jgi:hypothetical protein